MIRQYQLWAGIGSHVLSDMRPCPWIPSNWLASVRQSMKNNDITIGYEKWIIPPLRENDRFLMEDFCDYGIPTNQLEKLNACRMYLQVTTLAEITEQTGTTILSQALTSTRNHIPKGLNNISMSLLKWPTIYAPSSACWRLWSCTIRTLYTGSSTGTKLQKPLGQWTQQYNKYQFWHWRMEDPDHLVFRSSPTAPTRVAIPVVCRRNYKKFSLTVPTQRPFTGPPITPIDPNTGQVSLPVIPIMANQSEQPPR